MKARTLEGLIADPHSGRDWAHRIPESFGGSSGADHIVFDLTTSNVIDLRDTKTPQRT